jgi:chemotaxis signal transduction protein
VLLCVDRVDEVDPALDAYCQPLPLVIRQHLRRTWVSGVVPAASKPILVLDLRQIALDVATCDPYCVSYGNKS